MVDESSFKKKGTPISMPSSRISTLKSKTSAYDLLSGPLNHKNDMKGTGDKRGGINYIFDYY